MKYEILDIKYTQKYMGSYSKAIQEDCEKECLLGENAEYRMIVRDSIITNLTDPLVLLEYCIYPTYVQGDTGIGNRIEKKLRELAQSDNPIYIYQAVKFIYSQDRLLKKYEELPLVVNVHDIVPLLREKVSDLQKEMMEYREGEFALFPKNLHEMTMGMIKKTNSFN